MDPLGAIIPVLVIGFWIFLIYRLVRIVRQNRAEARANRKLPVETLSVRAVAKRPLVSGGGNDTSASTTYYVTFEYESGAREEFRVPGKEYGQIAEGDRGTLARQGTWYKSFTRAMK